MREVKKVSYDDVVDTIGFGFKALEEDLELRGIEKVVITKRVVTIFGKEDRIIASN